MAHVLHLNIDEEAGGEADGGAAGVFLAVDVEAAGADFRAFLTSTGMMSRSFEIFFVMVTASK